MTRGDTFTLSLAVTQGGSAFNLTGASVRMTAKYNFIDADANAVFSLTSPSGGILIASPATAGLATITVAPANTSSLPANTIPLFYDIQVTDSSSHVYTVISGVLTVLPDVSITTP